MDHARFDHLTRVLGAALTRRRGLAALGGGVIANKAAVRRAAAGIAPQEVCRPGLDYCGTTCCAPNERCRARACVNESLADRCVGEGEQCSADKPCCGNLRCASYADGFGRSWVCDYDGCNRR